MSHITVGMEIARTLRVGDEVNMTFSGKENFTMELRFSEIKLHPSMMGMNYMVCFE